MSVREQKLDDTTQLSRQLDQGSEMTAGDHGSGITSFHYPGTAWPYDTSTDIEHTGAHARERPGDVRTGAHFSPGEVSGATGTCITASSKSNELN